MARMIDRTAVGGVSVGGAGAPPVTPTIPAPKTPTTDVGRHQLIKEVLEDASKRGLCLTIDEIVRKTGLDKDTVRKHIDMMSIDGYAYQPKEDLICTSGGLTVMLRALKTLRGELD